MKKYICSNCGYRSRLQVKDIKHQNGTVHHRCRNCNAVVFSANLVLESMMRSHMIQHGLDYH